MVNENSVLGGTSSALFFALGGILGAAVAIFVPSQGPRIKPRLKKRAAEEEGNPDRHTDNRLEQVSHSLKEKEVEEQKRKVFLVRPEERSNKTEEEIRPSMTDAEYFGLGIHLD
jgi:hypothetical protein